MANFSDILKGLRRKLKYSNSEQQNTVSTGYAEKVVDALLSGDYETFKARYYHIIHNHFHYPRLFHDVKEKRKREPHVAMTSEEREVMDTVAFLDTLELYERPLQHKDLFQKRLNIFDTLQISQYAQSDILENLGGRMVLASFLNVYSFDELVALIKQFNVLAKKTNHDLVFNMSDLSHHIVLHFSFSQKSWFVLGVDQSISDAIPIADVNRIVHSIFNAFFVNPAQIVGIHVVLYGTSNQQSLIEAVLQWKENDVLTDLHAVNALRANRITDRNVTLTWLAAFFGDAVTLQKIVDLTPIAGEPYVNLDIAHLPSNLTPLCIATYCGHTAACQVLAHAKLPNGELRVDLNAGHTFLCKPIYIAVHFGLNGIVKTLVDAVSIRRESMVDLNIKTDKNLTLLSLAVHTGNANILQTLLNATDQGQFRMDHLNQFNLCKSKPDGLVLMESAIRNRQVDVLNVLLNATYEDGTPRIHLDQFYMRDDQPDGLSLTYIAFGMDDNASVFQALITATFSDGTTPRINCAWRTNSINGELFIEKIAYLAAINKRSDILKVIVDTPFYDLPSLFQMNPIYQGTTLMHIAIQKKDIQSLKVLIDARASDGTPKINLNCCDAQDESLAQLAVKKLETEILIILLDAKFAGAYRVDFNNGNKNGETPVHFAVRYCHPTALQMLVNAVLSDGFPRINLDRCDSAGRTPLWYAAYHGLEEIVKILLDAKYPDGSLRVSLDCRFQGKTARDIAKEKGHLSIVARLDSAMHQQMQPASIRRSHP